jgi:hypothetical protein
MDELRSACAAVATRARSVRLQRTAIAPYAASLARMPDIGSEGSDPSPPDDIAAYWLTLDAINFGSGWFPTLRKRDGLSGYNTVASHWREHQQAHGAFTPAQLTELEPADVAGILGQDPDHELMRLYASSLNDLGVRLGDAGGVMAVIDAAGGSAPSHDGSAAGTASPTARPTTSSPSRSASAPRSPPRTCTGPAAPASPTSTG